MKRFFLLWVLFTVCFYTNSQSLYMPRNIKAAYEKGTRSLTGAPGKNYWQNSGIYDVSVTVHTDLKSISGTEKIIYSNNSPDTLHAVWIRFVNNIHKPTSPRAGQVPADFLTSGLSIQSFIAEDISYTINSVEWGTINKINLQKPILPHSSASFQISWTYPLSKLSGREGQIDPHTFFCAYSYPRISVYDDYNGWDNLPHTDQQEFYNDFNDYNFAITVPKNYLVWATGIFENPEQTLQPSFYNRFMQSLKSDSIIHIANLQEMQQGTVTRQAAFNTWRFHANHITDFTFAISNHYVWDAGSVSVSAGNTSKRISVQAAYNDTAKDFKQYVNWEKFSIQYFSEKMPGVIYPYPVMTAVQGYADMEYPMMVNDASLEDVKDSRLTVDHEIAHTYFPFYMGINETRYAYMDEGWATTFEYFTDLAENGKQYADSAYKSFRVNSWIFNPATEMDQPVITMSSQLSGAGYGRNSYVKASLSYIALYDLLGETIFKKALHYYMNVWNGKHPIPWDYFHCFNTATGQNLDWFWNNWFFSNHYIDLKLAAVKQNAQDVVVTIENMGGFAIPFDLKLSLNNGTIKTVHYTPEVWKKNKDKVSLQVLVKNKINNVAIDGGIFVDANPKDNTFSL